MRILNLEERVNEGGDDGSLRKHQKATEDNHDDDYGKKPQFLFGFQKAPQFFNERHDDSFKTDL